MRKVLIMVDEGIEDAEFLYPYYRFQEEGLVPLPNDRIGLPYTGFHVPHKYP